MGSDGQAGSGHTDTVRETERKYEADGPLGPDLAAEMAAAAKVTIDQAVKTASEKVPGTIIEAELEKKHHKLVWEVEVVTAGKKVMEVHIDADTGAVIDLEEEQVKPTKMRKQEQKREHKD